MLSEPTRDATARDNVGKGNTDWIGCYNPFPGTCNKKTLQEVSSEEVRPADARYDKSNADYDDDKGLGRYDKWDYCADAVDFYDAGKYDADDEYDAANNGADDYDVTVNNEYNYDDEVFW